MINFLKRLEDFLSTWKNLHPDHSCKFIIITFQNMKIFKNPIFYLLLLNKVRNYFHAILKIIINFFVRESNSVWKSRITVTVVICLRVEIWQQLMLIFQNIPSTMIAKQRSMMAKWLQHILNSLFISFCFLIYFLLYFLNKLFKKYRFQFALSENIYIFFRNRHKVGSRHARTWYFPCYSCIFARCSP